jgi:chorismate synthase
LDASISHNLKSSKNLNLNEAIAQTVISKDELGKKQQPTRMVTRSRNSPGLVSSTKKGSTTVSPISMRKRELKHRQKEKENINLNQRSAHKLEPSAEKKHISSPI